MIDRLLFLLQRAPQLHQGDVLQLANALARDAEFLADFLQGLGLAAIEPEAGKNDLLLAFVEDGEQVADFVAQILVAQALKRRKRFEVADAKSTAPSRSVVVA